MSIHWGGRGAGHVSRWSASTTGVPSLVLDFLTTTSLDSRITFTRASTATFVGSNGLIQTAAINAPRFDYDPVTLAPKGLLIEESRFNAHTSSGLYDATWLIANVTVNAIDIATSPTGTGTKFLETTANAQHLCDYARFFHTASTTVTHSRWFRGGLGRDYIYMNVDDNSGNGGKCDVNLATGTIISTSNSGTGTNSTSSIQAFADGWYRVSISTQFTAASGQSRGICGIYKDATLVSTYVGETSKGLYVTGAQLEAGAFVTSYIPTTTVAVTRSADIATMTGANFSSWYNQTEGTFVSRASCNASGNAFIFAADDNTANNSVAARGSGIDPRFAVTTAGVGQADIDAGTISASTPFTLAGAYKANDFAASVNGGSSILDASGTIPTVDRLRLGVAQFGLPLNGHIRSIAYYKTRLLNTQLQTLSQ